MKIKLLCCVLLLGAFQYSCDSGNQRKIKLVTTDQNADRLGIRTAESVLQLDAQSRHSIVILPFYNASGDSSIDWLSRGLADMLTTELSQSIYLKIVPFNDLTAGVFERDSLDEPPLKSFEAARKLGVKSLVTGSFQRDDDLLTVETRVYDVRNKNLTRTETVSGTGLERIFSMVDGLSDRLVTALRVSGEKSSPRLEHPRATHSVEAFKCYSKALENVEQFSHLAADACLDKALNLDTTFAKAYFLQAKIKWTLGKHKLAEDAILSAKRYRGELSDTEQSWLAFIEAELEGDPQKLLKATQDILQAEPEDIEARMRLAESLFSIHKFEEAARHYELILEIDPSQKLAYNQLGYVHARRGDITTALEYLDKYTQLAPDEPNPYDSKGEILMQAGKFEQAAEYLKIALSKRPDFYHSAMRLARIYAELGDYDNAKLYAQRWFESATSGSEKAAALLHQASIEWRLDHPQAASSLAMEALGVTPYSPNTILKSSEMFLSFGDTSRALELQKGYLTELDKRIASNSVESYEGGGILRFYRQSILPPERLITSLERLAQSDKGRIYENQCGTHLGILYLRAGDIKNGIKHLSHASELIDVVVLFDNGDWSDTWKYHSEVVGKTKGKATAHLLFYDDLKRAASKTGRLDLVATADIYRSMYSDETTLRDTYGRYGFPLESQWQLSQPFANRSGFVKAFAPETNSKAAKVEWQESSDAVRDGFVNLRANYPNSAWSVAYAKVVVESDSKQKVQFRLGTDEASKLWLNGQLISTSFHDDAQQLDREIVSVVLKQGRNDILLKITNSIDDWGFYFRVTGDDGLAKEGVRFIHPEQYEAAKMAFGEDHSM